VGLPDEDARRGILMSNLKGIPQKTSLDLEKVVEATSGFNCADMVQLVTKAKSFPLDREKAGSVNEGITSEDFDEALKTVHSSVIKKDIERMVAWRQANG
jgi:SpoVK/Ycf46/Vps4 family AAA+-type ATPase